MKITFVTYIYPYPDRGFNPGIERVVQEYAHELAGQGHDVTVITTYRNGGTDRRTTDGEVAIHRVPDLRHYLGSPGSVFSLDQLTLNYSLRRKRTLLEVSDVVHAFTPVVRPSFDTPIVAHFHHWDDPSSPIEYLYRPTSNALWKRTYRRADAVVAISEASASELVDHGIDRAKIHTVPNGVDTDTYTPDAGEDRIELPDWEHTLLFVGPLVERKGLRYLVDALPNVLETHPDTGVVLVGDGDRERLANRARKRGVEDRISFEGFVPDEALPGYYTAADLFVFPTLLEGFGMVLVEAMACGLPVVTTASSAVPEVVGDAGLTVKPRSPDALAEAISRVLGDPTLHADLSSQGLDRVRERFTWSQTTAQLVDVYSSVVGEQTN